MLALKFPHKKIGIARAPTRVNKMSAWSNNVLIEQDTDEINDLEYVPVARHIPRAQTITEEYFESSGLSNKYYLDKTLVFQKTER